MFSSTVAPLYKSRFSAGKPRLVLTLMFIWLVWSYELTAQNLSVNDHFLQDRLRIEQLENNVDSATSMTIRPLYAVGGQWNSIGKTDLKIRSFLPAIAILPITLSQQYNSSTPYGWNDGLMLPAAGYQSFLTGGVNISNRFLELQIMPEALYSSNPFFINQADLAAYEKYNEYITERGYAADWPVYYGRKSDYVIGSWGQSSLRLNIGPVSAGVSNENLWWGPGRRNSLIMSNTARGFKHVTINTRRPINIHVGSLEGQMIGGRLDQSDSPTADVKNPDNRYLSGMVFTFQPKYIPGLFLGLTRVFQMYESDVKGISDLIPLFQPFEKLKTNEDYVKRDQLTSVFARMIFSKAQTELYFEYGRNDHSVDLRDFLMEPDHSRAYLVGFQKLFNLVSPLDKFLVSAEVVQMAQGSSRHVRSAGSWYVHGINQGYTHRGEIIGAGIGPGGNMQSLEFSFLRSLDKLGFTIERYVHDDDYYRSLTTGISDFNGQWIDLGFGTVFHHKAGAIRFSSKILGVKSWNYLWQSGLGESPQRNRFNFHANVGVSYDLNRKN